MATPPLGVLALFGYETNVTRVPFCFAVDLR